MTKKLFTTEDFLKVEEEVENNSNEFVDISDDIEEYSKDLEIATERFKIACNELNLINNISYSLDTKKLASIDYFISIENYRPVIETIANNLGVNGKIPSLEDFKNPYGTEASHQIAMEGFFDYIRKIWEKIKEIFIAFFKKIEIFFRRLVNAELDLETYEKYLGKMISDIKSKKKTLTDNKVPIDSKLPSLLADEGMESINSDFILSNGERKLKYLISVTRTVFQDGLHRFSKEDMKEFREKLKEVIINGLNSNEDVSKIIEDLRQLRDLGISSLNRLFKYQVRDIQELPDDAYRALFYHFDKNEIDDLLVYSLVDNTSLISSAQHNSGLPKNFNVYYMSSGLNNLFIFASTETNSYVQNKLYPIANADNLVKFYDFYKKFSKEINIKKIDSNIGDLHDEIDDIIRLMRTKFVDILEKLRKTRTIKKSQINSKEEALNELINYYIKINKERKDRGIDETTDHYVNDLINSFAESLGIDRQALQDLILGLTRGERVDEKRQTVLQSIKNDEVFIKAVIDTISGNSSENNNKNNILPSEEEKQDVLKEYEGLQKFLLNYLNNLQVMLKEISINLAGVYTQLRFELAKYIYNSARLYN